MITSDVAAGQDAGAAYWNRTCARCHNEVADIMPRQPGSTDALREDLDRFLAKHRAPDAEARAALIDWMIGQASE
jgi:hypothetical protein